MAPIASEPLPAPDPREARLLAGALDAFAERGVLATTVSALVAATGASVGSIYHRFASKEGLAAAVFAEALRRYQAGVLATLADAEGAEAGVRGVVGFHCRWIVGERPWAEFLMRTRPREVREAGAAALRDQNAAFFGAVRRWLGPHVRYGAVAEHDLALTHALWLGPAEAAARSWIEWGRPDLPTATPILADAAWAALRADPQSQEER